MNTQFEIGHAFGTQLAIHISWLWLLPFATATLVLLDLEPLSGAIAASLLLFGSVLAAALARIWAARRVGVGWRRAILFLPGVVVARTYRSTPHQESRIEAAGLATTTLLAIFFGALWYALPPGALGVEMEIVALSNVALLVFALLLRLSPSHDNLLHAALATVSSPPWPHYVMTVLHSVALCAFAVAGVFMLGLGWLAFLWWFAVAVLLSQLTTAAEAQGEYRVSIPVRSASSLKGATSPVVKKKAI